MTSSVAGLNIVNEEEHFPLGIVPLADERNVLRILMILSTKNFEKELASLIAELLVEFILLNI